MWNFFMVFQVKELNVGNGALFQSRWTPIGAPEMLCNSTFGFDRFERSDIKERKIWHYRGWVFFLLLTT